MRRAPAPSAFPPRSPTRRPDSSPAARGAADARARHLAAPHLVMLDEPTNHLDIDSRSALVAGINEFPGAVILVSRPPPDRGLRRPAVARRQRRGHAVRQRPRRLRRLILVGQRRPWDGLRQRRQIACTEAPRQGRSPPFGCRKAHRIGPDKAPNNRTGERIRTADEGDRAARIRRSPSPICSPATPPKRRHLPNCGRKTQRR